MRADTDVLPNCHVTLQALKPKAPGYPQAAKTLGEHVRKRRMDLGLIQAEAAVQIGVSAASVWYWEKRRREPEIAHLPGIIAFLGYDPRPPGRTLAERLVRFREARGWSQERLAAELAVTEILTI
jgi:transcriptional regulator with XRE-family HTH domain